MVWLRRFPFFKTWRRNEERKARYTTNLNGDDKDPLVSIVVPVFNAPG